MFYGQGIRLFDEASDTPSGGPAPQVAAPVAPAPQQSPQAPQSQTPPTPVAAPAAVQPPQQPASPAPVPVPGQQPAAQDDDPQWVKDRFQRFSQSQEQKRLKTLGVKSWDEVQTAIQAQKAAEDAKRTQEERAAILSQEVQTKDQALERANSIVREQAARMIMALSPEQKEAVTNFAGDDPAEQLRAIQHFGPTWAKEARQAEADAAAAATQSNGGTPATGNGKAQQAPAPAAPQVPPATTSPVPGAPASVEPGSPPDHRSIYQSVASRNPFVAAAYGLKHPSVYENKT